METKQLLTKNKYDFFEVASAFQKAIRRGEEEDALYWGIELYESGYKKYVWKRMVIMCSEDIGLGEPSCVVQVMSLKQSFDFLQECKDMGAMKLPFVQAILVLVRSRKSRYCDHAITVHWKLNAEEIKEFPDYVYDMHTRKGKSLGRGLKHFYEESCKILNANKIEGEEELEKLAWATDGVNNIQREDVAATDSQYKKSAKNEVNQLSIF